MARYPATKLTIRVPFEDPVYQTAMEKWPGLSIQKVIDNVMREWYAGGRSASRDSVPEATKKEEKRDFRQEIVGSWLDEE